jgi:hypothetical protein
MSDAAATKLGEAHGPAETFAELAERALSTGDLASVGSGEIERVLTAAIKLYAAKAEAEGVFPPVSAGKITPTEVVLVVSEMLRTADLNLFDLAMWYRRAG